MKRLAALTISWGLITLALAPLASASAYAPVVSPSPQSGPAGTAVTVIASGFLPGAPIEVHATNKDGTQLGTAVANNAGIAGIQITIPESAALGTFTIYVCGSCSSEFPEEASTAFQVTPPSTTTTTATTLTATTATTLTATTATTEAPPVTSDAPVGTDAPIPDPVDAPPCAIPVDAIVLDWDDAPTSSEHRSGVGWNSSIQDYSVLESVEVTDHGSNFWSVIWEWAEPRGVPSRSYISLALDPGMSTSSPPLFVGQIGPARWGLDVSQVEALPVHTAITTGRLGYVGMNVGYGVDGQYLPAFPIDEIVVELSVRMAPVLETGRGDVYENDWGTARIRLGPGPQPISTCLMLENPDDDFTSPFAYYRIDVTPMTLDGRVLDDVAFHFDDLFFGPGEVTDLPGPEIGVEMPAEGAITTTTVLAGATGASPPSDSSDLPWRVAFGLGGLLLGAVGVFWLKR